MKNVRRTLCALTAAAVCCSVSSGAALGENDNRCDAPGYHYGFTCDPPPTGTPAPPAPAPTPASPAPPSTTSAAATAEPLRAEPILTRPFRATPTTGGGMARFARA